MITQNVSDIGTRDLNMCIVYENSSEKFDTLVLSDQGQGHCRPSNVSPFTKKQTIRSYNLALVQAGNLILSII